MLELTHSFSGDHPLADEKTYTARYIGSGTFIVSKPKRKARKLRQSRLRAPRAGARK
jgi:hypothetical protein